MPFAKNAIDGARTYYENAGGSGPPLIFMYGFMDPVPAARSLPIAQALRGHAHVVFVDHRGHGRSDRPHDPSAYAVALRVADVMAVLDQLGLEKVHFAGISWGARLGFALGELSPHRLHSLILNGNQPYAWDPSWAVVRALNQAMAIARRDGTAGLLAWFENYLGRRLPDQERGWLLDNDPLALDAAWSAALNEGDLSPDLSTWSLPCLIAAGDKDEFHDNARRAAGEIPGAQFVSLAGRDHMSAIDEVDRLIAPALSILAD